MLIWQPVDDSHLVHYQTNERVRETWRDHLASFKRSVDDDLTNFTDPGVKRQGNVDGITTPRPLLHIRRAADETSIIARDDDSVIVRDADACLQKLGGALANSVGNSFELRPLRSGQCTHVVDPGSGVAALSKPLRWRDMPDNAQ